MAIASVGGHTPPQPQLTTNTPFRGAKPLKRPHREYQYKLETSVVVTSVASITSLSHIAVLWVNRFGICYASVASSMPL